MKNLLGHTTGVILNEYELDIIESALIEYGKILKLDDFRERQAVATSLRKIEGIRKAACCNSIRIEPI